jgi:hypothetical protein
MTDSSESPCNNATSVWLKRFDLVGRILCMLGIVGLGCFCLWTFRSLQTTPRIIPDKTISHSSVPQSQFVDVPLELLLQGNWRFLDFPWSVRVLDSEQQAIERWREVAGNLRQLRHQQGAESTNAADEMVWTWLHSMGEFSQESIAGTSLLLYRSTSASFSGRAYAYSDTPRSLQYAQMELKFGSVSMDTGVGDANSSADRHGTWIEICRSVDGPAPRSDKHSLLPIPVSSTILADRVDGAGRLCAQIIRLGIDEEDVMNHWMESGWRVYHMDQNANRDMELPRPSRGLETPLVVCEKEREVLHALFVTIPGSRARTLLLMRVSSNP